MRQAVEAQVVTAHAELGEHGLKQILADVIKEVRISIDKDINGADLLYTLLNAPWLKSLLKVYECLQQHSKSLPAPVLPHASGLCYQVLADLRSVAGPSPEAQELFTLLRGSHLQALLSAHDTVAQKDYEPVLPPLPNNLPDDEEATRIVCLVKNKQTLRGSRGAIRRRWDTLRQLTCGKLVSKGVVGARGLRAGGLGAMGRGPAGSPARSDSYPSAEALQAPPSLPSDPPSHYKPMSKCRICQRKAIWEKGLNRSTHSVCSSVVIDDVIEELDSGEERESSSTLPPLPQQTPPLRPLPVTPPYLSGYWSPIGVYLHPGTPPRHWKTTPHACTAPSSPMHRQRVAEVPHAPPAELAKQESLDELRTTVKQATSSMERSTNDVRLLGQSMAAATERMSESVLENAHALTLLAEVVDRLQVLIADSPITKARCDSTPVDAQAAENAHSPGHPKGQRGRYEACPAILQQLGCEGATIKRNENTGEISVARIIHGGLADRSGLLHAGDRIMEVNGYPVDGLDPEHVIHILAQSQGTIMFKVVPITERAVHNQTMIYMRAMADYNPQQDPAIPCADAGMSFRRGDLLEIVDQTDALWWQAKKLPSTSACAGLIPSTKLLRRKQKEFWWSQPFQPNTCIKTLSTVEEEVDLMTIDMRSVETDEETFESEELKEEEDDEGVSSTGGVYLAGFRRSLRLCRQRSHSANQSCHTRCTSTLANPYEEVVRYQRQPQDQHRVIALLGPSGVGVNELRRRLIESNPDIFQGPIPHTTRAPKSYEKSGREYHFISRELFENMIFNHRFWEYGEYKGHLYGTSLDAVKDVLNRGQMCVVDIEPKAIQSVRTHELRAYVIFVKPPSAERMKETRQNAQITTNYYVNRPFNEEDVQEIEDATRKIEMHFSQYFDHVIVNDELQDSCSQLQAAVKRVQDEPQWMPVSWIRPTDQS